jgi:tryptophanyl-tRNA synthetase
VTAAKKRSLTGIKPTGTPHIGNWLGAIRPAIELTKSYDSFLFIADLHALTTAHDPKQIAEQTWAVAATWLAFGLDPEKVVFYRQSDVPETATLAWILACFTPMGLLTRGHSLDDEVQEVFRAIKESTPQEGLTALRGLIRRELNQGDTESNAGIIYYPVLMAADILLYDTDVVPVGNSRSRKRSHGSSTTPTAPCSGSPRRGSTKR